MRVLLLTLVLTACGAAAPTQNNARNEAPRAITAEQAASLPPDRLADLVFRDLGVRMTAVSRRTQPPGIVSSSLLHLVFAGTPHGGTVGVCAAMRADVEFFLPAPPPGTVSGPATPTTTLQVGRIRAADVYKVVGEIEPYAEVSEQRAAEESQRCAAAGPVIPAVEGDISRSYYFTFEGDTSPDVALLVLQRAIADAREGRYRTIACAASGQASPECHNPVTLLGGLNMANLVSLRMVPPGLAGNRYVVRANFLIPGAPRAQLYRSVAVEADMSGPPNAAETIERLGRTEIGKSAPSPS